MPQTAHSVLSSRFREARSFCVKPAPIRLGSRPYCSVSVISPYIARFSFSVDFRSACHVSFFLERPLPFPRANGSVGRWRLMFLFIFFYFLCILFSLDVVASLPRYLWSPINRNGHAFLPRHLFRSRKWSFIMERAIYF